MQPVPPFDNVARLFLDEDYCLDFLQAGGFFYDERDCPNCETAMTFYASMRGFRCPKKNCRRFLALRKNSFFDDCRIPCRKVLHLAYHWVSKVPPTAAQLQLEVSKQVVCDYFRFFRELISSDPQIEHQQIGGPGIIVELDESKLGKRKYHRGHRVEGVWILGGVERTAAKRTFFVPVQDRSAQTLEHLILRHVTPGSIIHTDLWRGYLNLSQLGFQHLTVNHSQCFKNPLTGVHTNTIEGTWNGFKICIRPRNRVRDGIETQIAEFQWRRLHKDNRWDALLELIRDTHFDG